MLLSGIDWQREDVAPVKAVRPGRKAEHLVNRYLRTPPAYLETVFSMQGKRGIDGVPNESVVLQDREDGIGRARHDFDCVVFGRPGIEFDVRGTRRCEQPLGVGDRKVAAKPDRDMHSIDKRLAAAEHVLVHEHTIRPTGGGSAARADLLLRRLRREPLQSGLTLVIAVVVVPRATATVRL